MWTAKGDLISMENADLGAVRALLREAHKDSYSSSACAGKRVANLFFEDSTRTRVSFALAARSLGAMSIDLVESGSSMSKGESLLDTVWTIESMGFDAIVMRHTDDDAAREIAGKIECPLVNAGSGTMQHPTQALGDALVIGEAFGRTDGWDFGSLRIAIVGDVVSSRVAGSNIDLLVAMGAEVVLVGPEAMVPESFTARGCVIERDFDSVIDQVDVVMMLRVQFERGAGALIGSREAYIRGYQLDQPRAKRMGADAIVMHPGPMNRGVEIDGRVADSGRSRIRAQVGGGVRVRRAVLRYILDK
ncbi:MAG: aspartate carbamoyltransferase catalytic subunit [Phycisphaerales bacterium]|nr:aspartate carbamoyltransferase catalytic subunit [Phycisphaerales bacterium]